MPAHDQHAESAAAPCATSSVFRGDKQEHEYEFGKLLGAGTFGRVLAARQTRGGREEEQVAVKRMNIECPCCRAWAEQEVQLLRELGREQKAANVRFVVTELTSFMTARSINIVFKKLDISLATMIGRNKGTIPLCDIQKAARQLVGALRFLKGLEIVHGSECTPSSSFNSCSSSCCWSFRRLQ